MTILKNCLMIVAVAFISVSCNNSGKKTPASDSMVKSLEGNYVSEGYSKRSEGYDWINVSVKQLGDSAYHIAVRSRADKKKPTCTFDADAFAAGNDTLRSTVEGKTILFCFKDSLLSITTENEADQSLLNYFCSGGGSLKGSYKKLAEAPDRSQSDTTVFNKTLHWNTHSFFISSTGEGSIQQLTILPSGMSEINDPISAEIEGTIINAEIGDLNRDGFAEVLIYIQSAGSGSYGTVLAYSVNKGKSISAVHFHDIMEDKKASSGYMGHDEFTIIENSLARRFPVYGQKDNNSNPTGNIRQIRYKLTEGEASRQLVIDKIIEFPAN